MSNRHARIRFGCRAAVAATAMGATAAFAATTWTIKPGGARGPRPAVL